MYKLYNNVYYQKTAGVMNASVDVTQRLSIYFNDIIYGTRTNQKNRYLAIYFRIKNVEW